MSTPAARGIAHHPGLIEYVTTRRIAREYDSYHASNALFETDTRFLGEVFSSPGRLVDLGCGTGRHLLHFAARGYDVTGVDLSSEMLGVAREKLAGEGLSATLVRADICDLGVLADASFDYALCMFSTLGMIGPNELRRRVVREAHRVLRGGGIFASHVHNRLHNLLGVEGRRWLRWNRAEAASGGVELGDKVIRGYRGVKEMCLHIFTRREIEAVVREGGFDMVRLVRLNERRTGEIKGEDGDVRANGFLLACRKGMERL